MLVLSIFWEYTEETNSKLARGDLTISNDAYGRQVVQVFWFLSNSIGVEEGLSTGETVSGQRQL
jgi:hypothetical protein